MTDRLPRSGADLVRIPGVAPAKLDGYGAVVLAALGGSSRPTPG